MARKRRKDIKDILADPDLRRKLMVSTIQATQAREGIETTEEQADRAYYVVTEGENTAFFDLHRFRGSKEVSDQRHQMFITALKGEAAKIRFEVPRRDFFTIEGSPLAYTRIAIISHIFRDTQKLDPIWGIAAQGVATADDARFVRNWWEIHQDDIGKGKAWIPFAKGGDFCRFYADVYLLILWRGGGIDIRNYEGAYIRNEQHYFEPGLTWPLRTAKGFNIRLLSENCIFGHKGPAFFPNDPKMSLFLLGVANTHLAEFMLTCLTSFSWEVGVIKRVPVPFPNDHQSQIISNLAENIYNSKLEWDKGNEISTRFKKPWLLKEEYLDSTFTIFKRLAKALEHEDTENSRINKLYNDLNKEVYRLYNIPDNTKQIIQETLGDRPPEIIWPQMEGKTVDQKRMEHVWRLLSYIVKRIVEEDEGGIVSFDPVSGETGLMDRVYNDLELLFPEQSVTQVEVEIVNELKRKVKGYRSVQTIREWMEDIYFQYHVSLYKKRPIFWHISSKQARGPAAFGALVHYHGFDKNAMAKLRGTYLRDAIEGFRREAALAAQDGRGEDRIEWQAKLEEAEELDRRLQWVQEGYHEGLEGGEKDFRILTPWKSTEERPKGWDPDIDDGVKVNIEPLQKAGVLRIAKVV